MFKIPHGLAPRYLTRVCSLLTIYKIHYNLTSGMNISTPQMHTSSYEAPFLQTIANWSGLDMHTKESKSIEQFKV